MRGHKVRNSTVVFLRSLRFFFSRRRPHIKRPKRVRIFFSARWRPFGGRLNFDGRLRFDGAAGVGAEAGFGFGALRAPRAGNVRSKRSRERAEGTRKCAEGGWARALLLLAARGRPGGGAGGRHTARALRPQGDASAHCTRRRIRARRRRCRRPNANAREAPARACASACVPQPWRWACPPLRRRRRSRRPAASSMTCTWCLSRATTRPRSLTCASPPPRWPRSARPSRGTCRAPSAT